VFEMLLSRPDIIEPSATASSTHHACPVDRRGGVYVWPRRRAHFR
jgi:hypothetical protein